MDADCIYRKDKMSLIPSYGRLYIFNTCVAFHSPKLRPPVVVKYEDV